MIATLIAFAMLQDVVAAPSLDEPDPAIAQPLIAYDQCLAREAMRANRSDVDPDEVYKTAAGNCANLRAALIARHPTPELFEEYVAALEADKAATFPALPRQIRARRSAQ